MISPSTAGRYDSDDSSERHFEALGRQQSLDLMESRHLGRVAWQAADLPQILPITYAMHEGFAYFRTAPDSILAELAQPTSVALEVDELDEQNRSGWAIVMHGRTSAVSEPDALARPLGVGFPGPVGHWKPNPVHPIRPERVTGRVVRRPT